jgi:hypothetical protein
MVTRLASPRWSVGHLRRTHRRDDKSRPASPVTLKSAGEVLGSTPKAALFLVIVLPFGLDLLLLLDDLRWMRDGFRRVELAVAPGKQLHLIGKSQPFVCNSLPAGFDG